jgi:formate hydrogenlyase transcriptional activator
MQAALREREEAYRDLYEEAPVAYVSVGTDGRIKRANQRAATLFGYPVDALTGRLVFDLYADTPCGKPRAHAAFERFLAGQEVHAQELEGRRSDGRHVWVSLSMKPIRDAQGHLQATRSTLVDITDRKWAEAALHRLQLANEYLQEEIRTEHNFQAIVGTSPALLTLLRQVEQVALTDSTVLICGETGTGKELIARAIHDRSARKDRPLVKVNCCAMAAGLVESELFGHIKGAFTGAVDRRIGRFELADGGTIFLDEIGDLPVETQVKLLRVLQEQEFEPVGSNRTIRVDVRVIAATNRDLAAAVKAGRFRSDLFYRLHVVPLDVPPLRARRSDIPQLVMFFLERFAKQFGKRIDTVSPATMDILRGYPWPGNIRELQNILERAVVLSHGSVLTLDASLLPVMVSDVDMAPSEGTDDAAVAGGGARAAHHSAWPALSRYASLAEVERHHILAVLHHTAGVIGGPKGAARILHLHPNTLRSRMQKLGIRRPDYDIS